MEQVRQRFGGAFGGLYSGRNPCAATTECVRTPNGRMGMSDTHGTMEGLSRVDDAVLPFSVLLVMLCRLGARPCLKERAGAMQRYGMVRWYGAVVFVGGRKERRYRYVLSCRGCGFSSCCVCT